MRLVFALFFALTVMGQSYEVHPTSYALRTHRGKDRIDARQDLFLFEKYQGALQFDSARPADAKIQLTIDDMLAVDRYPSLTFVSSAIKPLGGDKY